jgi:hypothetical protein
MTVQDVRTVVIPKQAGPADPPLEATPPAAPAAPEVDRRVGRDRPLDAEERGFVVGLFLTFVFLSAIIVGGISWAQYVTP